MPDHRKAPSVNYHHTFGADPEDCRAYCFNDDDLMLWNRAVEGEWLSCEDAPYTRDFR